MRRAGAVWTAWEAGRWLLMLAGQAGNAADLATSLWGMRAGAREVAPVPAWLIAHGWPEPAALAAVKLAAAATIAVAWWAAGRPWGSRAGRIASVAGMGTLLALAAVLVGATAHNAAVLLAPWP